MSSSDNLTRDERIKKELARLRRSLKDIPKNKMTSAEGLIHRAAFIRVELEDLETDINRHGTTELGMHGSKVRASAQQHNSLVKNYATISRQLADLIPEGSAPVKEKDDAFQKILKRVK